MQTNGMSIWVKLSVAAIVLAALAAAPGRAQRGAITTPVTLADMVDEASTIMLGRVAGMRVEPHPEFANLTTIVVTLRVDEVLKGEAGETFTFRQFIWDVRDKYDAAGYMKAQNLLLLLTKPSLYGLSSPVGLEQGRFRIERDNKGKLTAMNGYGNVGLFADVSREISAKGIHLSPQLSAKIAEHRAGPMALDDLREIIRAMAVK